MDGVEMRDWKGGGGEGGCDGGEAEKKLKKKEREAG